MQKILDKKTILKELFQNSTASDPLSVEAIEQFYLDGMKQNSYIGIEYERLALNKEDLSNAPYEKVAKIIEHFASINKWELVFDKGTLIGAKDNKGNSLSLEPGNQTELSLAPKEKLLDIDLELTKQSKLLDKIAGLYDVTFLGYGISPKSSVDDIGLLNKQRYNLMNDYLPYCIKGDLARKMMRKTAGIQINVDYKDKKDAYNKLRFFNLIMPFMTALFSNSPIEDDKQSNFKSARAQVWRFTGEKRCNFFYRNMFNKKIFKIKNIFKNYIEEVLKVPMIYIERNGKNIPLEGQTNFGDFMKFGYDKYKAKYQDYLLHQSLCFPDVRLKNYIEIRNHDSNNPKMALALCAFYKGLCQSDFEELNKIFDFLQVENTECYYAQIVHRGLNFNVLQGIEAWDIVLKLFNISRKNLNYKERIYLNPILDMLKKRKTPADLILDNNIKNAQELKAYLY